MESAYTGFAGLYDSLMLDVDYDAWSAYLLALIERRLPERKVLAIADLACGTGEISILLAKRGHTVTGIDLSADMLAVAQRKARAAGLSIPFIQQDIRVFTLHKPVDVITVCCDGVNYLASCKDVSMFLSAAYRALKPGGLLLFDISSAYKLSQILDGHTFGEAPRDMAYIWQNVYDPDTRLIEMSLSFFVREGECYRRFDETHIQRAHTREEMDALLTQNGFATLGCYAAFTEASPCDNTERIQWITKRSDCK